MPTNRFASSCARCGEHVPAGQGDLRLEGKGWKVYCATIPPCQPRPAVVATTREQVGDLSGIMTLFAKARTHLKFPAIVIDVPTVPGLSIRLNVAGDRAREPGSLTVVDAERDETTGQRDWLGRVSLSGHWQPNRGPDAAAIGARLREFAAEPARIAAEYGRLHGICCFCRKSLKDERSTAVGYGKTCAENFGQPWGAKAAEFAGAAVRSGRSANCDQDNLRALWANIPGEA